MLTPIEIIETEDGSHSLALPQWKEQYHSVHGALSEALCVYIHLALHPALQAYKQAARSDQLRVFEMGFGTGLNALLSWQAAEEYQIPIHYTALEAYPLEEKIWTQLNYKPSDYLQKLHQSPWEKEVPLSPYFNFFKREEKIEEVVLPSSYYDVFYYDAFAPTIQENLWTLEIFQKLRKSAKEGGTLSTYCAKGSVKRALRAALWDVKNLPGPKGKREITQAFAIL